MLAIPQVHFHLLFGARIKRKIRLQNNHSSCTISTMTHITQIISWFVRSFDYLVCVVFGKKYDFYIACFANECLRLFCFAAKHTWLPTIWYIRFCVAINNLTIIQIISHEYLTSFLARLHYFDRISLSHLIPVFSGAKTNCSHISWSMHIKYLAFFGPMRLIRYIFWVQTIQKLCFGFVFVFFIRWNNEVSMKIEQNW